MAITPVQSPQTQAYPVSPLVDSSATNAVKIVINEPKVIAKTSSQPPQAPQPQPSQAPCNCETCTKSFIA